MTSWRPASGPDAARRRAAMLERIRQHFKESDVLAVDTPSLSQFAASDVQIESFQVDSRAASQQYFLNTSPEFNMKRLLAAGYPDIYSICRVFRDGEAGKQHQPEFTMVEWYRLGFDLDSIVADTTRLIASALAGPALHDAVDQYDYADVFQQHADIDIFTATIDELAGCGGADADLRRALGDDRDALLDLILSTKISRQFADDRLTVLRHYPASQAALARLCPSNERVADRFEVFLGSTELANGYVELTDAAEQRHRIDSDQAKRQRLKLPVRPHDRALLASLESGLPQCAGVAVGLERLQMMHDSTDDIGDVVAFLLEKDHD